MEVVSHNSEIKVGIFDNINILEILSIIFCSKDNKNYYILSFKDLVNFSEVSKKCYEIAHSLNISKYWFENRFNSMCFHSDNTICNINDYFYKIDNSIRCKSNFYKLYIKNVEYSRYLIYILRLISYLNKWDRLNHEMYLLPAYQDCHIFKSIFRDDVDDILRLDLNNKLDIIFKKENLNKIVLPSCWIYKNFKMFLDSLQKQVKILIYYGDIHDRIHNLCDLDFKHIEELKLVNSNIRNWNIQREIDFSGLKFSSHKIKCLSITRYYIDNFHFIFNDDLHFEHIILNSVSFSNIGLFKNVTRLVLIATNINDEDLIYFENIKILELKRNIYINDLEILGNFNIEHLTLEANHNYSFVNLDKIPNLTIIDYDFELIDLDIVPNFKNNVLKIKYCTIHRNIDSFLEKLKNVKTLTLFKCFKLYNVNSLSNFNTSIDYLDISYSNIKYIDHLTNIKHIVYYNLFVDYYLVNNIKELKKSIKLDFSISYKQIDTFLPSLLN